MKATSRKIANPTANPKIIRKIFVDGAGCRPDGKGSKFAWTCPETGEKHIECLDGLTNNQAEYRGLVGALDSLPLGTKAEVFSDSLLMCSQFNGEFKVNDPSLSDLLEKARAIIARNKLKITLQWIRRAQNLAGKLL